MAEQQLINYIKDAKKSGQSDEQTRSLLYKNGWTETEVKNAFNALNQSPAMPTQPQPQMQPQAQPITQPQQPMQPSAQEQYRPQVQTQPQPQIQPQTQPQPQAQVQYKPAQPQVQTQPQTSYQSQSMARTRKPSRSMLVPMLIIFIFVLLLGSGGFLYALYSGLYNPSWNPFKTVALENSKEILDKMFVKMAGIKQMTAQTDVQISIKDTAGTDQGKLSLSSTTRTDTLDPTTPKADMAITVNLTDNQENAIMALDVNAITNGNLVYAKLNTITSTQTLPLNLSTVQGKWLLFDDETLKVLSDSVGTTNPVIETTSLQPNYVSFLKDIITADKKLADEVISGQNTNHYQVKLNVQALKTTISNLLESSMLQEQPTEDTVTQGDMVKQIVDSVFAKIGDITGEVWIGKTDDILYQYKMNKQINLDEILPGAGITFSIALNSTMSNFNTPLEVVAPEDTVKAEIVLLPLIKQQKIASAMDGIVTSGEIIFAEKESYATLCVGKALDEKQADLALLVKDLLAQGASKPGCFVAPRSYCVSTQLADKSFMCAGANADLNDLPGIGTTKCTSPTTICK